MKNTFKKLKKMFRKFPDGMMLLTVGEEVVCRIVLGDLASQTYYFYGKGKSKRLTKLKNSDLKKFSELPDWSFIYDGAVVSEPVRPKVVVVKKEIEVQALVPQGTIRETNIHSYEDLLVTKYPNLTSTDVKIAIYYFMHLVLEPSNFYNPSAESFESYMHSVVGKSHG